MGPESRQWRCGGLCDRESRAAVGAEFVSLEGAEVGGCAWGGGNGGGVGGASGIFDPLIVVQNGANRVRLYSAMKVVCRARPEYYTASNSSPPSKNSAVGQTSRSARDVHVRFPDKREKLVLVAVPRGAANFGCNRPSGRFYGCHGPQSRLESRARLPAHSSHQVVR